MTVLNDLAHAEDGRYQVHGHPGIRVIRDCVEIPYHTARTIAQNARILSHWVFDLVFGMARYR